MKTGDSLTSVCASLLIGTFVYALVTAWPIMIAVGVLHSYWSAVPAFGFLAVLILGWAADLLLRVIRK